VSHLHRAASTANGITGFTKEEMMDNGSNDGGTPLVVLAETENFAVVVSQEEEGESIYNIELGNITLHFYQDEWDELVELVNSTQKA
jgi:hypothetical protein